jgi:hypothetical protein
MPSMTLALREAPRAQDAAWDGRVARILRDVDAHRGRVFKTTGDSFG